MSIQTTILQASDYEAAAKQILDAPTLAYIAGGSGDETTLQANQTAFKRSQLQQRAFAEFSQASTQIKLLNTRLRHPILLAPVAAQSLVHPDGEIATAQAAEALEAGMIISTRTSKPLDAINQVMRQNKWFQLYFQPEHKTTASLIKQAEENGAEAIVVTLDSPIQSVSLRAQKAGFTLPAHAQPALLKHITPPQHIHLTPDDSVIFQGLMQQAPALKDIEWLINQTHLPVLVKGVMALDEIDQLRAIGIQGLVVSNHGGRALDSVPDSLRLLAVMRAHTGKDFPLLFDGGVRSGYDAFKAIATGANAVCIGRLQLYALAVNGAQGVAHVLKLLRDELELCMALTGCTRIADISEKCLWRHD